MSGDIGLLARATRWMRGDRWLWLGALVAALLATAFGLAQPILLGRIVDALVAQDAAATDLSLAWLGCVVAVFLCEASYLLWLSAGALGAITRLRGDLFAHILARPLEWHDREPSGRLLSRVTSDVEALGETLTAGAVTLVLDVLVIVGVVATMFWLDVRLTAVLLLVAPPLALIVDVCRRKMRTYFVDIRNALAELTAFVSERLAGHAIVQLYSDEVRARGQHEARLLSYRNASIWNNVWDALLFAVVDGVSAGTLGLMLAWAANAPDVATAGLLAAFVDCIARLFTPVRELSGKVAILQRASTSLEKIFAILDDTTDLPRGRTQLPHPPSRIEAKGLSFAYPGGPTVLQDVDLAVERGQTVALVGRTGSGKSTLAKLFARAIGGHRGQLTFDGLDVDSLDPATVRAHVGVVQQDARLFTGTVRSNLSLGANLPDDRLMAALNAAQAHEIALRLGGLDGQVAAGGRNLSVGEAQLLAFARALAHNRPIVVLDEPTASVDSATEHRMDGATRALLRGRTVILVAHRLSTVAQADQICVMEGGRIVERGRHADLLASGGRYAELWHAAAGH